MDQTDGLSVQLCRCADPQNGWCLQAGYRSLDTVLRSNEKREPTDCGSSSERSAEDSSKRGGIETSGFDAALASGSGDSLEIPVPELSINSTDEIRILYLDDDPEIVELAKAYLEQIDDRFVVAGETKPLDALTRVQREEFDCVVSDYAMPTTDGIEFLELVRAHDSDIPFVLYTARGTEEIREEALSAGATEYLSKNPDTEEYELLADRVLTIVDNHRLQQRFRETIAWYRRLAERNLAGVFVVREREFVYVNSRFAETFGYGESELIGESPRIFADTAPAEEALSELLKTTHEECETVSQKFTATSKNGTEIDVEVYAGSVRCGGDAGCLGLLWRTD